MRKEQIIAIFLGSLIGVGAAFFLWRVNKTSEPKTPQAQAPAATALATQAGFSIVAPQENSIVGQENVEISGFSSPNAPVAVVSSSTSLGSTNSSGEFLVEAELTEGINKLTVLSFEKGKAPSETELTLFYTTKLDLSAQKNAKAIAGSVTDIAADTLQVRTDSGQIEQALLSEATTFASNVDTPKEISFTDLAIGDFVLVLGFVNEGSVLEAGHVLVTSEPQEPVKLAVSGIIKTLSSREFLVSTNAGEEVSVDAIGGVPTLLLTSEGLENSRLSTAEEGQEIVIFGEMEEEELVAERIILL